MIELRYSRKKFHFTLLSAILLTVMITALAWMLSIRLANAYSTPITAGVALVFFVFCSIGMLSRYYRDEVILAIRQAGLFDKRLRRKIINWDEIKEVVLLRRENDFQLEVILWPMNSGGAQGKSKAPLTIDLEPFDIGIEDLMQTISAYTKTRLA